MGDGNQLRVDLHLPFRPGLEPGDGQPVGRHDAGSELFGKALHEEPVVRMVKSVSMAEIEGSVDADPFRIA